MNRLSQTVPLQYDTGFSPFPAARWREALADLHERGLTGVEIAVAYPERIDVAALLAETERNGLAVTTISTGQIYGLAGLFLSSPDPAVRAGAADAVRGHIALARQIGRPPVTIGLLRGKLEPEPPAVLTARLIDALRPLADAAGDAGVTLQLEYICAEETAFIHTAAEALDVLRALGDPPYLGLLYDSYHANLTGNGVLAEIGAAAGRITNVHLADSHRGLPGEGTIDFPAVCRAILDTGYTGAFALETLSLPTRAHVLAHYADSIKSLF